jgi:hypothetical protein
MADMKSTGMPIEFTMDRETKMHLAMGFLVLSQHPIAEMVWPEFCEWSPHQVERGLPLFTSVVKEIRLYSGVRAGWSFSAEIAADMLKDINHLQTFFIELPDLIRGPPLRHNFEEVYYNHWGEAELERFRNAGFTIERCQEPPHWLMKSREKIAEFFDKIGDRDRAAYEECLAEFRPIAEAKLYKPIHEIYLEKELDHFRCLLARKAFLTLTDRCKVALHAKESLELHLE